MFEHFKKCGTLLFRGLCHQRFLHCKVQQGGETEKELSLMTREELSQVSLKLDLEQQKANPLLKMVEEKILHPLFPTIVKQMPITGVEQKQMKKALDQDRFFWGDVYNLISGDAVVVDGAVRRVPNASRKGNEEYTGYIIKQTQEARLLEKIAGLIGDVHRFDDPGSMVNRAMDRYLAADTEAVSGGQNVSFHAAQYIPEQHALVRAVAGGLTEKVRAAKELREQLMDILFSAMDPVKGLKLVYKLNGLSVSEDVSINYRILMEQLLLKSGARSRVNNFSLRELAYISLLEGLPVKLRGMSNPGILEIKPHGIEFVDFDTYSPSMNEFDQQGFLSSTGLIPRDPMHGKTGRTPGTVTALFTNPVHVLMRTLMMASIDYDLLLDALLTEVGGPGSDSYQRGVTLLAKRFAGRSIKDIGTMLSFARSKHKQYLDITEIGRLFGLLERLPSFLQPDMLGHDLILVVPYEAGLVFLDKEKGVLDIVPYHEYYLRQAKQFIYTYVKEEQSNDNEVGMWLRDQCDQRITRTYEKMRRDISGRDNLQIWMSEQQGVTVDIDSRKIIIPGISKEVVYTSKFSYFEMQLIKNIFDVIPAAYLPAVRRVVRKFTNRLSMNVAYGEVAGEYNPREEQVSIYDNYIDVLKTTTKLNTIEHALAFAKLILHEFGHNLYVNVPEDMREEFRSISKWELNRYGKYVNMLGSVHRSVRFDVKAQRALERLSGVHLKKASGEHMFDLILTEAFTRDELRLVLQQEVLKNYYPIFVNLFENFQKNIDKQLNQHFLTQYAYSTFMDVNNDHEDFAEHFVCYLLFPADFQRSAPLREKKAFIKRTLAFLSDGAELDTKEFLMDLLVPLFDQDEIAAFMKNRKTGTKVRTVTEIAAKNEAALDEQVQKADMKQKNKDSARKLRLNIKYSSAEIKAQAEEKFGQFLKDYRLSLLSRQEYIDDILNVHDPREGQAMLAEHGVQFSEDLFTVLSSLLSGGGVSVCLIELRKNIAGLSSSEFRHIQSQIDELCFKHFGPTREGEQNRILSVVELKEMLMTLRVPALLVKKISIAMMAMAREYQRVSALEVHDKPTEDEQDEDELMYEEEEDIDMLSLKLREEMEHVMFTEELPQIMEQKGLTVRKTNRQQDLEEGYRYHFDPDYDPQYVSYDDSEDERLETVDGYLVDDEERAYYDESEDIFDEEPGDPKDYYDDID